MQLAALFRLLRSAPADGRRPRLRRECRTLGWLLPALSVAVVVAQEAAALPAPAALQPADPEAADSVPADPVLASPATAAAAGGESPSGEEPAPAPGRVYYVRQAAGEDANDGLSPATAWRHLSKLARLEDGDTAYVGPGFYRQEIIVQDKRGVRLIADPEGRFTGDPPGLVMLAGSEPLDEAVFEPDAAPGVYRAHFPDFAPSGIVEMDGEQYRYLRARSTREHLVEGLGLVEVVARLPATYHYDEETATLYLQTGDGRSPADHEMEVIRRGAGVSIVGSPETTVVGFTIRHVGDGGIIFGPGSDGGAALGNRVYGSRQGVRVNGATGVLVAGNTLFRNENSGVYYLRAAAGGAALGNVLYQNAKGLRWSSQSNDAVVVGNTAFDNLEAGIAIESAGGARLADNRLAGNRETQLLLLDSRITSEGNCFEVAAPGQLIARLSYMDRFETLEAYRRASGQERGSRTGGCGPLPAAADVGRLHADAFASESGPSR